MSKIIFIQTGGTIDKDYPRDKKGWAFEIGSPAVSRILKILNPSFKSEVIEVLKKDSLELDSIDRRKIEKAVKNNEINKVIITHGTDTMIETASFLAKSIEGKVVIITGAMKPERFKDSDALINVGVSIGAVQTLENGVYICMHGVVKKWNEIQRDLNGKYI